MFKPLLEWMYLLHHLFPILPLSPGKDRAAFRMWTMTRPGRAAESEKEGASGSASLSGGAGPSSLQHLPGLSEEKEMQSLSVSLVIATYPTQTLGFNTIFQIYFLKMLFFNCSQCCLSIWTFSGYFSVLLDFWHSFRSNHHFTPVCHYIW